MGRFKRLGKRVLGATGGKMRSALARADAVGGEVRDRLEARLGKRGSRAAAPVTPPAPPPKVPWFDVEAAKAASGIREGWANPELPAQVFGRRSCSWSGRATRTLRSNQIEFEYIEIEGDSNAPRHDELKRETGHRTVPYVFLRGRFIGGYNELSEIERLGQLEYLTLSEADRANHPLAGKIDIAPRPKS